jgi:hypothetical protein
MNKKPLLLFLLIVVVCGVFASYLLARQHGSMAIPTTQTDAISATAIIREPISIPAGQSLGRLPPFSDTSTGATVTFKEFSTGSRNPSAYVYLNGEKIDQGDYINVNGQNVRRIIEVGGEGSDFDFSVNDKFFAFRTQWQSGCCALDFAIFVLDINNKVIFQINPPKREQDYHGPKESPTQSIFPVIESYEWNKDSSLILTFYFAGYFNDDKYYRISPKEIWRYDLSTKQYTFLKNLPAN